MIHAQEEMAETIFCRKGFAESIWITYLPNDILINFMNARQPEAEVLKDF